MAPKPAAKPTTPGKKPTGAGKKGAGDAKPTGGDNPSMDDQPMAMSAPKNKEEVLAQVSVDGLPDCDAEQIVEVLRGKYEPLVQTFIHYCKHSDCKTMELSTRLRLGAASANICGAAIL